MELPRSLLCSSGSLVCGHVGKQGQGWPKLNSIIRHPYAFAQNISQPLYDLCSRSKGGHREGASLETGCAACSVWVQDSPLLRPSVYSMLPCGALSLDTHNTQIGV